MAQLRRMTRAQAQRPIYRRQTNWSEGMKPDLDPRDAGEVGDNGTRGCPLLRNVMLEHRGMSVVPMRDPNQCSNLGTTGIYPAVAMARGYEGSVWEAIPVTPTAVQFAHVAPSATSLHSLEATDSQEAGIAVYESSVLLGTDTRLGVGRASPGATPKFATVLDHPLLTPEFVVDPAIESTGGVWNAEIYFTVTLVSKDSTGTAVTETNSCNIGYANRAAIRLNVPAVSNDNIFGSYNGYSLVFKATSTTNLAGLGYTHVRVYRTLNLVPAYTAPRVNSPDMFYLVGEYPIADVVGALAPGVNLWTGPSDTATLPIAAGDPSTISDAQWRVAMPASPVVATTAAWMFTATGNRLSYAGAAQIDECFGYHYPEQVIDFPTRITALVEVAGWLTVMCESSTWRLPLTRIDTDNPYKDLGVDVPLLRDPLLCDNARGVQWRHRQSVHPIQSGMFAAVLSDFSVRKFNGASWGPDLLSERVRSLVVPLIRNTASRMCSAFLSSDNVFVVWDSKSDTDAYACLFVDEPTAWAFTALDWWHAMPARPNCAVVELPGGHSLATSGGFGEPMLWLGVGGGWCAQGVVGTMPYTSEPRQVTFGAVTGNLLHYFVRHLESHFFFQPLDANPVATTLTLRNDKGVALAAESYEAVDPYQDGGQITLNGTYGPMHYYTVEMVQTGGAVRLVQFDTVLSVTDRNDAGKKSTDFTDQYRPAGDRWTVVAGGSAVGTIAAGTFKGAKAMAGRAFSVSDISASGAGTKQCVVVGLRPSASPLVLQDGLRAMTFTASGTNLLVNASNGIVTVPMDVAKEVQVLCLVFEGASLTVYGPTADTPLSGFCAQPSPNAPTFTAVGADGFVFVAASRGFDLVYGANTRTQADTSDYADFVKSF